MNKEFKVIKRTVYGRELIYPSCDIAYKFADLLNVKTFNASQLKGIAAIGFDIVYLPF